MLGKLRFKTSMFEGVLDDGEDSVFISDDKFSKMMETVSGIVEDVEDSASTHDEDTTDSFVASTISVNEEEKSNASYCEENKEAKHEKEASVGDISNDTTTADEPKTIVNTDNFNSHRFSRRPTHPKELVAQGVSFLSGLAEALKSPEATAQLVDSIVEKNELTGETTIKIPVENKETVANLISFIGKLFMK